MMFIQRLSCDGGWRLNGMRRLTSFELPKVIDAIACSVMESALLFFENSLPLVMRMGI
jgi:hypothetical protein